MSDSLSTTLHTLKNHRVLHIQIHIKSTDNVNVTSSSHSSQFSLFQAMLLSGI